MIYFGCVGSPGHYYYDEHLTSLSTLSSTAVGLPWAKVDGTLTPEKGWTSDGMAALHHNRTPEGLTWTALAIHDYSVDSRGGSNSVFFEKGDLSFEEMVKAINERPRMKRIWDRICAHAGAVRLMQIDAEVLNNGRGHDAPEVVVVERKLLEEIGHHLEGSKIDTAERLLLIDKLASVLR